MSNKAFCIASINRKKYAGLLPEAAVTAHLIHFLLGRFCPRHLINFLPVVCIQQKLRQARIIPPCRKRQVPAFGMTRTIWLREGKSAVNLDTEIAAAMEMTNLAEKIDRTLRMANLGDHLRFYSQVIRLHFLPPQYYLLLLVPPRCANKSRFSWFWITNGNFVGRVLLF